MKTKEKYLNDIETIKDLLITVEEKSFIEHWTFYFWGAAVIAGTLAHLFIANPKVFSPGKIFYIIWLPVLLICGIIEIVSWYIRAKKDNRPVYTRSIKKFLSAWAVILLIASLTVILFIHIGAYNLLPVIILAFSSYILVFYGIFSYSFLITNGYILAGSAVLIYFLKLPGEITLLLCGMAGGVISIISGILIKRKETHAE